MNYLSNFLGINKLFESIQGLKASILSIEENQKTILESVKDSSDIDTLKEQVTSLDNSIKLNIENIDSISNKTNLIPEALVQFENLNEKVSLLKSHLESNKEQLNSVSQKADLIPEALVQIENLNENVSLLKNYLESNKEQLNSVSQKADLISESLVQFENLNESLTLVKSHLESNKEQLNSVSQKVDLITESLVQFENLNESLTLVKTTSESNNKQLNSLSEKIELLTESHTVIDGLKNQIATLKDLIWENNKTNQQKLDSISEVLLKKINDIESELKPKPFPDSFKLLNPVTEEELFSFGLLQPEEVIVDNLDEVEKNPTQLLQFLGSIPNFYSTGMLANSFRFSFPNGISGNVMNIGSGYGTAITNSSGHILEHGTYLSNFIVAAPLLAYQAADFIIKQHYLAKINNNLKEINTKLDILIKIEFIKKEVEIESIVIFFQRAFRSFDELNKNNSYKNATLSNIISKNIQIQELIFFYKKTFNNIDKKNTDEITKNLSYLLLLNDLYVYGKILEFKYAGHFYKTAIQDLKTDLNDLKRSYKEFFNEYSKLIEDNIKSIENYEAQQFFLLKLFSFGNKSNQAIKQFNKSKMTLEDMCNQNNEIFDKNIPLLEDLLKQIEQPQEITISNGRVYQRKNNSIIGEN